VNTLHEGDDVIIIIIIILIIVIILSIFRFYVLCRVCLVRSHTSYIICRGLLLISKIS
jgi:hypothetical protein